MLCIEFKCLIAACYFLPIPRGHCTVFACFKVLGCATPSILSAWHAVGCSLSNPDGPNGRKLAVSCISAKHGKNHQPLQAPSGVQNPYLGNIDKSSDMP